MAFAEIRIYVSRGGESRAFEFADIEALFEFNRAGAVCELCGWRCGGVGALVEHFADNCHESATVGKLLERLAKYPPLAEDDGDAVEEDAPAPPPPASRPLVGRLGYFLREAVNEFRCRQLAWSGLVNEFCFGVIRWLERHPAVVAERRRDRGA